MIEQKKIIEGKIKFSRCSNGEITIRYVDFKEDFEVEIDDMLAYLYNNKETENRKVTMEIKIKCHDLLSEVKE